MRVKINENFNLLSKSYLFEEIDLRVADFKTKNPEKEVISLGIGDVSLPLSKTVAQAMANFCAELSQKDGFLGYGSSRGDIKLRDAIAKRYGGRGIALDNDEIFVSDGAKSDLGGICDLFSDNEVVICDPVYPVYHDTNVMCGRKIRFLSASAENGFLPSPKQLEIKPFLIYLCSPNNPTGACFSRKQLKKWVDFALESGSLIIFDAAYEAYISDEALPHSIFEIEGAKRCTIEVCSFSKSAGFTGVRCGWTVVPKATELNGLFTRRQATKFGGASRIAQMGALASLSDIGARECAENVRYYMKNAKMMADFLKSEGISFVGGENAPYLWLKCPLGLDSWQFFNFLLEKAHVVGVPGVGFGRGGEGFLRLSAFASHENTQIAINRIRSALR
jgi:LL-diaminopimelate aminotransferase